MTSTVGSSSANHDATPDQLPAGRAEYWDEVAGEWNQRGDLGAWRSVSDAVNTDLIDRWLPKASGGAVLKTDLFDELVGTGLVGALSESFGSVAGIDVSPTLVDIVQTRHPQLDARVADIRELPFEDLTFEAVVSNSTLDHFPSPAEIAASLREINRVLRPGGSLLVTLDNGMNPVVAARNALPARWRDATGLVPYDVGATCRRPRDLQLLLEDAGFGVAELGAVLHCPRVIGVLVGNVVDRRGSDRTRRSYARTLVSFERLARLPTRFITGHFVAALAVKE
jgi:SAM-dependent methyltransferase